MITIEILGALEIEKDLLKLDKEVENEFHKSIFATAQLIESTAKRYAPSRTGKLRNSITIEKINNTEYSIGTDLEYAQYLEFGTRYMQPQPFMRPASLAGESFMVKDLGLKIDKVVRGFENGGS